MKSEFVQRALLGFVLASILATDVYSAPSLEPLDIGSVAAMNLDRRLYAIAHDPSLMTKLDQRKCFRNTEAYDARLAASVAVARRVLPELISVTNLQKAVTAMCLADGRVYFWLSLDDRILLGWIPMVLKNGDAEKKLVLWLVPKKTRRATSVIFGNDTILSRKMRYGFRISSRKGSGSLLQEAFKQTRPLLHSKDVLLSQLP